MKRTIVFSILFASVIAFTYCGSFGERLLAGMSGMGYADTEDTMGFFQW